MSLTSSLSVFSPAIFAMPHLTPWSMLNQVWQSLMGYQADEFKFTPGSTPLSTFGETATTILLYYIVILGGRELMRPLPAFKLDQLFLAHNFILTCVSGALLVLFLEQLLPDLWNHGLYYCICETGGWTAPLETLYYLNYLTKYVELIDTLFLVLKKKPLTFLHCYHHGATALLCYTQLVGKTSVSWVPITLNLIVHVVMYWYYYQSARGVKVWWKKWITRLQITQFVIDLGFIYFAAWTWFASAHAPSLPHVGKCSGDDYAAPTGCLILSSYLVLFISFYFSTYRKSPKPTKVSGNATKLTSDRSERKTIRRLSNATSKMGDVMKVADGAWKTTHATVSRE